MGVGRGVGVGPSMLVGVHKSHLWSTCHLGVPVLEKLEHFEARPVFATSLLFTVGTCVMVGRWAWWQQRKGWWVACVWVGGHTVLCNCPLSVLLPPPSRSYCAHSYVVDPTATATTAAPFQTSKMQVTFKLGNDTVLWNPGMANAGRLPGTLRTLDHKNGSTRCGPPTHPDE